MTRRAHKVDVNHATIRDELRQIPGVTVFDLAAMGDGCADLLAARLGVNYLLEVKAPNKRDTLTKAQRHFRSTWTGQYAVVESTEDALQILGVRT